MLAGAAGTAWPQTALEPSRALSPPPSGEASRLRPLYLRADELRVRPDLDAVARGRVELHRAGTVIKAEQVTYDQAEDLARAVGDVQIRRDGNVYRGPELQLRIQRFEGFFLHPEFEIGQFGSGGRAERVDFLDPARSVATAAMYSSCPRDGSGVPDWLLQADRVSIDTGTQTGSAEGAVLRFLGVPILALPVLTFPISDERKSGWLPPDIGLDSQSGVELGVPYYWNIAPNRDATITPTLRSKRGASLTAEFRYLEPSDAGRVVVGMLPDDRISGTSRHTWLLHHDGQLEGGLRYRARAQRVSDHEFWKDFPHLVSGLTPRLLPMDVNAERSLPTRLGAVSLYARALHWQVLQTADPAGLIVAPYQRSPQLGIRLAPVLGEGWRAQLETELNHFTRPEGDAPPARPFGWRWHALGELARSWQTPGSWLTPKFAFNAAGYSVDPGDGSTRRIGRLIPTFSVDTGLVFERESRWFGATQRQTLEPRLLYVRTPYRNQLDFPNFDSAVRDFNLVSLFAENAFSGVDRVSDANQLTVGLTSRLIDQASGAQTMLLAIGQRMLFADRRVSVDGEPFAQRLSDVLLEGSTSMVPRWQFDASLQYSAENRRIVRSTVGARYSPGPFRTVSANYLFTGGLSEQLQLAWQWPLYRGQARPVGASGGCGGTLYGVGRVNYDLRGSRTTESILGFEYDTGCWIGRLVSQRVSTGTSDANVRLMLQLELVGLSRLGVNPLQVLKDNVPGYRLLRDPSGPSTRISDGPQ